MKQNKNEPQTTKKRRWWFQALKGIMKIRYKRPAFVYLGEKFGNGGIILSNHEGTDAPMSLEIYGPSRNMRMWGAHEMNSGLKMMYKYQTQVYYHEKKHWNLHAARAFCLLASPLTNLFYKGLDLISTYHDARFTKTIRESLDAIEHGDNIVIFPEDSTKGYLAELEGFYGGFVMLAEVCRRKGIDVPIYVTYYRKKDRVYVIDKPVLYSELCANGATREEVADKLRLRCNELGKMQFSTEYLKAVRKANKESSENTLPLPEFDVDEEELKLKES